MSAASPNGKVGNGLNGYLPARVGNVLLSREMVTRVL